MVLSLNRTKYNSNLIIMVATLRQAGTLSTESRWVKGPDSPEKSSSLCCTTTFI